MLKNKTVRKLFLTVFCFFAAITSVYAESCSSAGAVEYKYTASGCSYTTQTRTCCAATGAWSDWGGTCPSCDENSKPATSESCGNCGTRTRTLTCNSSTGKWDPSAWSACSGEGVCSPGATKAHSSVLNAVYTCTAQCKWPSYYSCTNTAMRDMYLKASNGYWSSKFCKGICCDSGSMGYDAIKGPSCKRTDNGRPSPQTVCD